MKPVAIHCMFHGISDKATGPKSQVPTSFCPWISWMILGFHPNFHRPKHNRNLQWNQFFSSSCTWSFICHTINNVPYIMGATEGNRHEWLGLQPYKKTSSRKSITMIQWFKNNFGAIDSSSLFDLHGACRAQKEHFCKMDGLLGTFVFWGNVLGTFVFFRERIERII